MHAMTDHCGFIGVVVVHVSPFLRRARILAYALT
jgi:hypothetical protein